MGFLIVRTVGFRVAVQSCSVRQAVAMQYRAVLAAEKLAALVRR